MTSVKEFLVEEPATAESVGRGRFVFTDDYSVFDWGAMPDAIPRKGASLCAMGAANFERLEAAGVATHYRGVVTPDAGTPRPLAAVSEPPREMAIDLVASPQLPFVGSGANDPSDASDGSEAASGESNDPAGESGDDSDGPGVVNGYDYGAYYEEVGNNYLVPLEIVFRNWVPVGSSLRGRREPSEVGLDGGEWPEEAVELPEPVIEFSTKFEEQDRYLTRGAADRIAGPAAVTRLEEVAREVNELVTERADRAGLVHEDGKIECYYANGDVGVADVVGTLDENRFAYDGQELSKEVVRQYYKREHPSWVESVNRAKERAAREDVADWRSLCDHTPPALPDHVVDVVSDAYAAAANAYLDRALFDAPPLADAVAAVREL
ncbi:MAG: phosphoribosylaminoimidazolesuccinocarboxamide synthase [Halobaculum sp.]